MMNKKQAIGLMVITTIFVALIGLTCDQAQARDRAAEGLFGGAVGGALIGGAVGGGRGAAIGAGVGAGVGLAAGAAADEAYYIEDDIVDYPYDNGFVSVEEDYYPNNYYRD